MIQLDSCLLQTSLFTLQESRRLYSPLPIMTGLFDLPLETRELIYSRVVVSRLPLLVQGSRRSYSHDFRYEGVCRRDIDLTLFLVSRRVCMEAMVPFYTKNILRFDLDSLADERTPHNFFDRQPPPFSTFGLPRTRRQISVNAGGEESQTEISREVVQRFQHIELVACENDPSLNNVILPPTNSSIEALFRELARPPPASWQASGQQKDIKVIIMRWQGFSPASGAGNLTHAQLPTHPQLFSLLCMEYPDAVSLLKRAGAQSGRAMLLTTQNREVAGAPNPPNGEFFIQLYLTLIGPNAQRPSSPSWPRFISNYNAWR